MGKPIFEFDKIPFNPASENSIKVHNETYNFHPISMGNPHAVIKLDTFDSLDFTKIGETLQDSTMFPESVNVNFLRVIDDHKLALKVFERGSGMTLACGSGACASAVIAIKNKWVKSPVQISMDGGLLEINEDSSGKIELIGPAKFIFDGEMNLSTFISHE